MSLTGLLIVSAVAFVAPIAVQSVRRLRIPSPVAEIVAGIAIGPAALGWVKVDAPIAVVSMLGLSMLLFLAGLEIDVVRLRGRVLRLTAIGMVLSLGLAVAIAYGLRALGLVQAPLLIAITLSATALGLIIPVLKDAGELDAPVGTAVVAGATVAEFSCITLLSLLFSRDTSSTASRIALLCVFAVAIVVVGGGLFRYGDSGRRVSAVLTRLQDTTAQIRVRFAVVLFIAFATLASTLGLETILGAFVAGAMLKVADRDAAVVHPLTMRKLEAIGFGFLVPVFWVATGLRFDLHALLGSGTAMAETPIFLAALVVIRAVPAVVYVRELTRRELLVVGLLQATSLSFIVAATQIGADLGLISPATSAALVAAGLLSAVLFPAAGLAILGRRPGLPDGTTSSLEASD